MTAKRPNHFTATATPQDADNIAVSQLAPRLDWTELDRSAHVAQFYESDDNLINSLAGFVHAGLQAGDAGIVVATDSHRAGLEQRLRAYGVDLAASSAAGQYVSLDAAETLSKLMVDQQVHPQRFSDIVGTIVSRASEGGRQVRIFGELVALLWAAQNYSAVMRLEQLWNTLQNL